MIDFQTAPAQYRHWQLSFDGAVATLAMDVDPAGSLFPGCELKLNSYDLGVDIELADAVQRLRFEHPEVRAVVLRSAKPNVFCAGANIRMLSQASHGHKVNFCKFTNETRLAIEDAGEHSGQRYLAAISGSAAGGGYELAVTADWVMLIDDRRSSVSLPELPLLAVLPGTGGLTRLTDKRKVRRDLADVFCTTEEGVRGRRAVAWRLVDEVVPPSSWEARVAERAAALAAQSDRPAGPGIVLTKLDRRIDDDAVVYPHVRVDLLRTARRAVITLYGPKGAMSSPPSGPGPLSWPGLSRPSDAATPMPGPMAGTAAGHDEAGAAVTSGGDQPGGDDARGASAARPLPTDLAGIHAAGAAFWPLALARELDDALLHLRLNEPELGLLVFRSEGDPEAVLAADALLQAHADDWLVREIRLLLKRVFKRVDMTARSLVTLIEPNSCFAGSLAELVFAADRALMHAGDSNRAASLALSALNFGAYPMGNGLTRLATRFLGEPDSVTAAREAIGQNLDAATAEALGLVTAAFDAVDWDDEVRVLLEERASYSPDALTGLEANLRFAGPETMETRIFGRLTAWQNWIFQRPSAAGEAGSLKRYGTGLRPDFSAERV